VQVIVAVAAGKLMVRVAADCCWPWLLGVWFQIRLAGAVVLQWLAIDEQVR